jgi:plastocyanin
MSVNARNYSRLAIAVVVAAVVVSASILSYASFESTVTKTTTSVSTSTVTTTVTTTPTCETPSGSVTAGLTVDCQSQITLALGTPKEVLVGQDMSVLVSLTNDLPVQRDVNYTQFPALPHGPPLGDLSQSSSLDFVLPLISACGFPSTPAYEPAFIYIYNASGHTLQLNDQTPSLVTCISSGGQAYHPFNASQVLLESISVEGYWTSANPTEPWINATYNQFSPGTYTVVAFDPWGQLTEQNFSVVEASGAQPAPQITIPSGASANSTLNFEPSMIHVLVGVNNTVTFTNDDRIAAEIESTSWPTNASGFEDLLNPGQSWTVELTAPGVYNYTNGFHPVWMKGAILVSPSAG